MSNCQKGQMNAITKVFQDTTKLRCYFHLIQNIQRMARNFKVHEKIEYILWVTKMLKEAKSELEFEQIWALLKSELLGMTTHNFLKSYEDNFVNSQAKWFVGASFVGKQKTNNSLESINRYLKDNWTSRVSRTVPEFFVLLKNCFIYYNEKCSEKTCMPMDTRDRKEIFQKSEKVLEEKNIFSIFPDVYAFIRIAKKHRVNQDIRKIKLAQKMENIDERIEFLKENFNNKFANLTTFAKTQGSFHFFNSNSNICSCTHYMNTGTCKHQVATLLYLNKVKNPYKQQLNEASQVGRPRNLQAQ